MKLMSGPQAGDDLAAPGWRHVELPGRGTTFACDLAGPHADSPAVVLLHGYTATGLLNWATCLTELGEQFRVIALDHRGHGDGIRGDGAFTLADCADDVAALLRTIGVERAIVVGYSMGGPIAQLVWQRHPDLVDGLVLCATAADFRGTLERRLIAVVLASLERVSPTLPRSLSAIAARAVLGRVVPDAALRSELLAAFRRHDAGAIREAAREVGRFCSTGWIADLDVPAVVVVTSGDRIVPPRLQLDLAQAIPHAAVVQIDATHMAPFVDAELFARTVADACLSIPQPARRRSSARRLVARLLHRRRHRRGWRASSRAARTRRHERASRRASRRRA